MCIFVILWEITFNLHAVNGVPWPSKLDNNVFGNLCPQMFGQQEQQGQSVTTTLGFRLKISHKEAVLGKKKQKKIIGLSATFLVSPLVRPYEQSARNAYLIPNDTTPLTHHLHSLLKQYSYLYSPSHPHIYPRSACLSELLIPRKNVQLSTPSLQIFVS